MKQLYKIQIVPGIVFEAVADMALGLRPETRIVVRCEFYQDVATVKGVASEPFESLDEVRPLKERQARGRHVEGHVIPEVLHVATEAELRRAATNAKTAEVMHRKTIERIRSHQLGMRLIQSHYSLDGRLLLCQFTADGRVDFRELLQDLSSLFRTRIELRQVGVRDEAAIIGGVGTCGRPYCCATFLHSIASVNVRMAKQQGISLTPQNISGACGRLKCCLHFEQPAADDISCSRTAEHRGGEGDAGDGVSRDEAAAMSPRRGDHRRHGEEEQGSRKKLCVGGAVRRGNGGRAGEPRRSPSVARILDEPPKKASSQMPSSMVKPQQEAAAEKRPPRAAQSSAKGEAKSILPLKAVGIVPLRPSSTRKDTDE